MKNQIKEIYSFYKRFSPIPLFYPDSMLMDVYLDKSELDLDKSYKLRNILNLLRGRTFNGHPACSFYDRESLKSYYVRVSITEKPEQE